MQRSDLGLRRALVANRAAAVSTLLLSSAAFLVTACEPKLGEPPDPQSITPATATAGEQVDVEILGRFSVATRVSFKSESRSHLKTDYTARVGSVDLLNVQFIDSTKLTATVPGLLPAGLHDLTVENAAGRIGLLRDAFTVTTCTSPTDCADRCYPSATCTGGVCVMGTYDANCDSTVGWPQLGDSAGGVGSDTQLCTGTATNTRGNSAAASVQIDPATGDLVMAWEETVNGFAEIFVKRWDATGKQWVEYGSSASSTGISGTGADSQSPTVMLDGSGNPVVLWEEDVGGTAQIYVKYWDSGTSQWKEYDLSASGDGMSNSNIDSVNPSMVLDSSGFPVIAWEEDDGNNPVQIFVRHWSGSVWAAYGNSDAAGTTTISGTGADSQNPVLALDNAGDPIVAWEEDTGGIANIYLRHFSGGSWIEYAGTSSGSGNGISGSAGVDSTNPSIAVDSNGDPIVAWEESDGTFTQPFVLHYSGGSWLEYGSSGSNGIINTPRDSKDMSITTNSSGDPIVAWVEDVNNNSGEIFVMWWDQTNSVWKPYDLSGSGDGISAASGDASNPAVVTDGAGNPIVIWEDGGQSEIQLRQWSGSAWTDLADAGTCQTSVSPGGVSSTVGDAANPSMVLDSGGMPVVAWEQKVGAGTQVYVAQWNSTSWVAYGTSLTGNGISGTADDSSAPKLALDGSGDPVVAWEENVGGNRAQIYLRYWNSTSSTWDEYGSSGSADGVSNTPGDDSGKPSLALESATGFPAIAWEEDIGGVIKHPYIKHWDGGNWVPYGTSDSATGVSLDGNDAGSPVVALDGTNQPVVAWEEQGAVLEILVARFVAGNWVGLNGSHTEPGISNSGADSGLPTLVIDATDQAIVAWEENVGLITEIYLLEWNETGTSWDPLGSSNTGGGVSGTAGNSTDPALAIDASEAVLLSWSDDTPGSEEVYLLRRSAGVWAQIGPSSALGGGVSNTITPSVSPSVSCSIAAGLCAVAWEEALGASTDIWLRVAP